MAVFGVGEYGELVGVLDDLICSLVSCLPRSSNLSICGTEYAKPCERVMQQWGEERGGRETRDEAGQKCGGIYQLRKEGRREGDCRVVLQGARTPYLVVVDLRVVHTHVVMSSFVHVYLI